MTHGLSHQSALRFLTVCAVFGLLSSLPGSAAFAQGTPRVSKECLDCHSGRDSTLAATMHALPKDAASGPGARVACTDCHSGDRRHWEEDPKTYPMPNPAGMTAASEARVCATCHQTAHQQNMLEKNPHSANGVNCSGCHSVHGGTHTALLKLAEPQLCFSCHGSVAGQFAKPYRHPVNDGLVKCSECHTTLSETSRPLSKNGTNVCLKCHGEFEGPFPFEHAAGLDFSTEEGGCLNCHEAHGSHLPRMLKQPYEAPHFQLCTQCHAVPRHNLNPMHGTTWSGKPCNDCHTDIHGSYSSHLFLRESLQSEGCFNAGCHKF